MGDPSRIQFSAPQTEATTPAMVPKISITQEGLLKIGTRQFRVKVGGEVTNNPETLAHVEKILKSYFGEDRIGQALTDFERTARTPQPRDIAANPVQMKLTADGKLTVTRKTLATGETEKSVEKKETVSHEKLAAKMTKIESQVKQHVAFREQLKTALVGKGYSDEVIQQATSNILDDGREHLAAALASSKNPTSLSDLLQQKGAEGIRSALCERQGEKKKKGDSEEVKACTLIIRAEVLKALTNSNVKVKSASMLETAQNSSLPKDQDIKATKDGLKSFFKETLGLGDLTPNEVFDSSLNVQVSMRKLALDAKPQGKIESRQTLIRAEIEKIDQKLAAGPSSDTDALKLKRYALVRLDALWSLRQEGEPLSRPNSPPPSRAETPLTSRSNSPRTSFDSPRTSTERPPSIEMERVERKRAKQQAKAEKKQIAIHTKTLKAALNDFTPEEIFVAKSRLFQDKHLPMARLLDANDIPSVKKALQLANDTPLSTQQSEHTSVVAALRNVSKQPANEIPEERAIACEKALRKALVQILELDPMHESNDISSTSVIPTLERERVAQIEQEIQNDIRSICNLEKNADTGVYFDGFRMRDLITNPAVSDPNIPHRSGVFGTQTPRVTVLETTITSYLEQFDRMMSSTLPNHDAIQNLKFKIIALSDLLNFWKVEQTA